MGTLCKGSGYRLTSERTAAGLNMEENSKEKYSQDDNGKSKMATHKSALKTSSVHWVSAGSDNVPCEGMPSGFSSATAIFGQKHSFGQPSGWWWQIFVSCPGVSMLWEMASAGEDIFGFSKISRTRYPNGLSNQNVRTAMAQTVPMYRKPRANPMPMKCKSRSFPNPGHPYVKASKVR